MTNDEHRRMTRASADRREPVGEPAVRGDPTAAGDRACKAISFDLIDPDSLVEAVRTVRSFSESTADNGDHVFMLHGTVACAAFVRGVGLYRHTAERAGDDVFVSFIRKWAYVYGLPQSVRRCVARGRIAPTVAKHITRASGDARLHLA